MGYVRKDGLCSVCLLVPATKSGCCVGCYHTRRFRPDAPYRPHLILNVEATTLRNQQNNQCALCGVPEPVALDHYHDCPNKNNHWKKGGCEHCIRGWLCYPCNMMMVGVERLISIGYTPFPPKVYEYLVQRPILLIRQNVVAPTIKLRLPRISTPAVSPRVL